MPLETPRSKDSPKNLERASTMELSTRTTQRRKEVGARPRTAKSVCVHRRGSYAMWLMPWARKVISRVCDSQFLCCCACRKPDSSSLLSSARSSLFIMPLRCTSVTKPCLNGGECCLGVNTFNNKLILIINNKLKRMCSPWKKEQWRSRRHELHPNSNPHLCSKPRFFVRTPNPSPPHTPHAPLPHRVAVPAGARTILRAGRHTPPSGRPTIHVAATGPARRAAFLPRRGAGSQPRRLPTAPRTPLLLKLVYY